MIKRVLIDSNIWYHAYIQSEREEFKELHDHAKQFLLSKLNDNSVIIAISSYQIVEIMELLRKGKVNSEKRKDLYGSFLTDKFFKVEISLEVIGTSFYKSLASDIHIYDYLVALPLKSVVSEVYSADDHLQHSDFQEIAIVTNPLSPWILREGREPHKT